MDLHQSFRMMAGYNRWMEIEDFVAALSAERLAQDCTREPHLECRIG
jgi:hypothetical protein